MKFLREYAFGDKKKKDIPKLMEYNPANGNLSLFTSSSLLKIGLYNVSTLYQRWSIVPGIIVNAIRVSNLLL